MEDRDGRFRETEDRDDDSGRVARYQPPDPRDLEQHPPRDATCSAVRAMLRDHCDGELAEREIVTVDDHVHGCRECALALSRMELEVLRLRQAFEPERRAAQEVPEDLSRRVMALVGRIVLDGTDAPPQFTNRVMERVRREWRRPSWWGRTWSRGPAVRLATVAAVVVLAVTVLAALQWLNGGTRVLDGFEVVAAHGGVVVASGESTPEAAVPGRALAPGEEVRTSDDGSAVLVLSDEGALAVNAPREPGAVRVDLDPASACRALGRGELLLVAGLVEVRAARPWTLELPDGAAVALDAAATALVSVAPVRRHDTGGTLRSRVEVFEGRARILRGSQDAVPVGAGLVATFDSLSIVEVDLSPTAELLARAARAGRSPAVGSVPVAVGGGAAEGWAGRVVDGASGRGVQGAVVDVVVGAGPAESVRTDADGWFHFTAPVAGAAVAVVRVRPPVAGEPELSGFGPEPLPLDAAGSARRLQPIALAPDVPVRGVLWRESGGRLAGATVTPCVVDDLFEVVDRLESAGETSDRNGSFTLRGLPSALPRHQMLALLIEAPGLPRHVSLDLGRRHGPVGALEIIVPEGREVVVAGLGARAEVRVLREIPGVPLAAMAEEHRVVTDASGRTTLHGVGRGPIWSFDPSAGTVRRLVASGPEFVASAAASDLLGAPLRLRSEPHLVGSEPVALAAQGTRFGASASVPGARAARFLSVRDDARAMPPRTRLFLQAADGTWTFLGEADAIAALAFAPPSGGGYRLIAVGVDGSVGVLDGDRLDEAGGVLTIQGPGSVEVDAAVRAVLTPGAMVAFDLLDGPFAGRRFWRVVDAGGGFRAEDLIAGSYRATFPDGTGCSFVVESRQRTSIGRTVGTAPVDSGGR